MTAANRPEIDRPHDHSSDPHHHEHNQHHGHTHGHEGDGHWLTTVAAALHLPGFTHQHGYEELAADRALRDNELGIRTVWLALGVLGLTTILQIAIYLNSGSVALLADTVHNLGDALNSVPLLIALYLARRPPTQRFTYGLGRAEDVAGILIVISIAFSAAYILYESVRKLINPQPLDNLVWIGAAALVGFLGNELVAIMQIRVGRQIGSDAMIADGQHARIDGLTSLAVLIAVFGSWIGWPILDPIIGIVIGVAIVGITWSAIRAVWFRLMDAADPEIMAHLEAHLVAVDGVIRLQQLRGRWVGHRLFLDMILQVDRALSIEGGQRLKGEIRHELEHVVPQLGDTVIELQPASRRGAVEDGLADH